jgi:hypothetical protein
MFISAICDYKYSSYCVGACSQEPGALPDSSEDKAVIISWITEYSVQGNDGDSLYSVDTRFKSRLRQQLPQLWLSHFPKSH